MTDYFRGEQFSPAALEDQLRRMWLDWYSAPENLPTPGQLGPLANGAWLPLPDIDVIRVRLTADWDLCGLGVGVQLTLDSDGNAQPGRDISLRDPAGIIAASLLMDQQTLVMPAGTCLWAIGTRDGPAPEAGGSYYEPFNFGECCRPGSGSSPGTPAPPTECGVPCPEAGYVMRWVDIEVGGQVCRMLVACPTTSDTA